MDLIIAYPWALGAGCFFVCAFALWRLFFYRQPRYVFPYTALLQKLSGKTKATFLSRRRLLFFLRLVILVLLVLAFSRPQIPDHSSKIEVQGRDMILALDVSGSMQLFDDVQDQRSRFDVAKKEALAFIAARKNDPIGLVFFGATAVSRCPLTLDKPLLFDILKNTRLGDISPDGTVLAVGLGMAVNRLKNSQASSKIIILLTDGEPSPHDIPSGQVIELAKKYGIKVYTIGVGSDNGGYGVVPLHGIVLFQTPINKELLQTIASETGGEFFLAEKPDDMQRIYGVIDALETSACQAPVYARYYECGFLILWVVLALCFLDLVMRLWWVVL